MPPGCGSRSTLSPGRDTRPAAWRRPRAWGCGDYGGKRSSEARPYDAFLRQQIAGDELQPPADENLVATGFLAGGRLDVNQEDRVLQRNDHLLDITNMMASVLFG